MRVPSEGQVESNGLRLHYLNWRNPGAPALLLLHGSSAHARWWDFFAEAVADRYDVFALDLRGHGDSGHADPPAYGLDDYVGDVAAVVAALRLPSLSIVGHSLGAIIAVAYASRAKEPIDALALVDIRVRISATGRRYLDRLRHWPHPVYPSRAEAIRRFRLLPSSTVASASVLAHVASHGLQDLPDGRCTPKFDRAALSDAAARDVSDELGKLTCPILYVRGAKSTLATHAAAEEVRAIAPHARIVEIPSAYHHVMLDNPWEFERAVGQFLDEQRRPLGKAASGPKAVRAYLH